MKHLSIIALVFLSGIFAFLATSCSTDFELNAPYEATPVIFGVLDKSVDTQYVKINKSFIGGGNNESYAAINDSSLYKNVVGRVEEYVDGIFIQDFILQEKWIKNLDAGIFYTDSQKVYYFVPTTPPGLNENAIYKLVVDIADEAEPITAETNLAQGSALSFDNLTNLGAQQFGLQFADATTLSDGDYLTETPGWESVLNGKRYELSLRLHFTEVTSTGSTDKYINWSLASVKSIGLSAGEQFSNPILGATFYDAIGNKLKDYPYEANVLKRVLKKDNIELILTVANDNLNTFIEINEPSTGVVTEKPIFTNVQGGVGIFASRFSKSLFSFLDSHSSNVLCASPTLSGYKFCIDPVWDQSISGKNILITYPLINCN